MSEIAFPRREVSRIELSIPAGSEWVRVARLTVAGVASRLPFPIDAVEDIKLAVTEAINNAIQHSPAPIPLDGEWLPAISIVLETTPEGLWISVADKGRVEGELRAAPPAELGELPEGGLGLMLIRSLMDEVDHQSGPDADTIVRMFKRVPALSTARVGTPAPIAR